jgi:hypothetical protein
VTQNRPTPDHPNLLASGFSFPKVVPLAICKRFLALRSQNTMSAEQNVAVPTTAGVRLRTGASALLNKQRLVVKEAFPLETCSHCRIREPGRPAFVAAPTTAGSGLARGPSAIAILSLLGNPGKPAFPPMPIPQV